jgi:hypothetical protein
VKKYHVDLLGGDGRPTRQYVSIGGIDGKVKTDFSYLKAHHIARKENKRREKYYNPGYKTFVVVPV